jgi:hypothetical protein
VLVALVLLAVPVANAAPQRDDGGDGWFHRFDQVKQFVMHMLDELSWPKP